MTKPKRYTFHNASNMICLYTSMGHCTAYDNTRLNGTWSSLRL